MLLPIALFLGFAHLAVITSCNPLNHWHDLVVKHSWNEIPEGWEYKAPAPADYVFELKIGIKQPRIDKLFENLMKVSDPEHPRYGEHLNREQVNQFMAPHPDSIQVIDEWLAFHGIMPCDSNSVRRSKAGDWVTVRVTVEQAERLLVTKYHVFKHGRSGDQVVRTLSYSIPEELLPHVDLVAPTTYFGTLQSMKTTNSLASGNCEKKGDALPTCSECVTPDCIRQLYNFTDYRPSNRGNKLGVAGFLEQYASRDDLQKFLNQYRQDAVNFDFSNVSINGGKNDENDPGIEANLDIQFTAGLAYPTPLIFYSTGGSPPIEPDSHLTLDNNTNEPYLEFLQHLLDEDEPPQVVTISYGDNEQSVPLDYAINVCKQFAALAVRGTTVFVSSGDSGVGMGDCLTNDGKNQTLFQPSFPATCPYVTAVGGTSGNPEIAAENFGIGFSGGGFSRYFSRPDYQDKDVADFIAKLNVNKTYDGLYNSSGRAYPDVSAQAANYAIFSGGELQVVYGTSASSPVVAAIFSNLVDYRLSLNSSLNAKTAGFGSINQLLYSKLKSGFNDITNGTNRGCKTPGFSASAGWDPVTGLGTPNFPELKKLIAKL